jgi:predicted nicotinamide N-methyase
MSPRFHCTPPEAVAETLRETVFVGDYTFCIDRPAEGDKLLDHPWCRSAYVADEYVPYWPTLWPSARMLAKAVLKEPWETYSPQPVEVLEVGCGLGLAGVACLARGLKVTFSDVDETAVAFAARNAKLNGYPEGFRTRLIDFRCPPDDVKYPVVIGSDLMYEERLVVPLVRLLEAVLAPGGVCLIADPDRLPARAFRWKLQEAGYDVAADFARAGEPGGERTKGTIYRIRFSPGNTRLGERS